MNWLAHVLLSEPDIEFRMGNLLADVIKGQERKGRSERFLLGVRCHQVIDNFTDYHPLVWRSRSYLRDDFHHFTGILLDIFHDHCLARNWHRFADVPLSQFTHALYAELQEHIPTLPSLAAEVVARIIAEDRLGSYRELAGIEQSLARLSRYLSHRLRRPVALAPAVCHLKKHYAAIEGDFLEFFPDLRSHVSAWCGRQGGSRV
ncbi:MAG: ACP phosphodiesterase [Gemmataceae bacterium]